MSVSKAVISGIVTREPEKRFTGNDLAIANFVMNIDEREETLLRVITIGKLAEKAAEQVTKGSKVIVEGRLQTNTVKDSKGEEKRIIELQAADFDVFNSSSASGSSLADNDDSFSYGPSDEVDELIGDDEIPF
ncbi:MAG: single-stranded DNA-binding protein [Candidatus Gastranaerophilales bacterium]|nr:single-stranded DNA-binding protein [Candidatus Gastranaerophilales bacterium]